MSSIHRSALALATIAVLAGATVPASAATIYWTDFTSDTIGQTNGAAAGTITTPTGTIGVTYSGEVAPQTVIDNSYPSWGPSSSFADGTVVADAPTFNDLIAQQGGPGTGANTITFSTPVTNLVMAIWSLGSGGDNANYTFSQPFNIVAGGPSNEYGGGPLTLFGANGIAGNESNGTIVFTGTFSFVNTNFEDYYGFQLGVAGIAPPAGGTAVPEPASLALLGVGLFGLGAMARRKSA